MTPIPKLLIVITILQFTKTKACQSKAYLQPYSHDIVTEFPPLRFPGPESTGDVSGLEKKLSDVEKQIKAMELAKQGMTMGASATIGFIPVAGGVLESATGALGDHLMSAADLEDLSADLKIQLGIKEELAKYSLSNFKAQVKGLKSRLEELSDDSPPADKKTSAKLAVHECEKILQLFQDESYLFSGHKLIFYPHLVSFTGLYAKAAAAAAQLDAVKLDTLEEDMELLRTTLLKYHPVVKRERLNKFHVPRTGNLYESHLFRMQNCPEMQKLTGEPSSPLTSCVRGDTREPKTKEMKELLLYILVPHETDPYPVLIIDTITGEVFCGWVGCWEHLLEHYGSRIDKLTLSALELIPLINKPPKYELPPAPKKDYSQCQLDGYDRLSYQLVRSIHYDSDNSDKFGCEKGYCWSKCHAFGWCYTKNPQRDEYAECGRQEDCCPEWKCHGACSE